MATIIKVNGQTIKIEPKSAVSTESLFASIESIGNDIDKDIAQLNVIGNVQAMESFGYKATEAVMDKVKDIATGVWEKIKTMFGKLVNFLGKVRDNIKAFMDKFTKSGIDSTFNTMRVQRADFENVLKNARNEQFSAKLKLAEADTCLDVVQQKTNRMHEVSVKLNDMKLVEKAKAIASGGASSGGMDDVKYDVFGVESEKGDITLTPVSTFGEFMGSASINDLSAVARKYMSQFPQASKSVMAALGIITSINKNVNSFTPSESDSRIKVVAGALSNGAKTLSKAAISGLNNMNALSGITKAEQFCIQYYNAHHEAPAAANA